MIKILRFKLLAIFFCTLLQPAVYAANVTIELVPSSRVILKTIPGMSVDDIIKRIYPKDTDLWPQIKDKLIAANPNSFYPETELLVDGTRLKLIDIKRFYEEEQVPKTKVGYVAGLQGKASASYLNGRQQTLQINSQIYEGDRIETAVGTTLSVLMDDGAEVHLKSDSVLKINEYVITKGYGKESSSILDLLRGGLRKITGAIGASTLANYQVQAGLAIIGIRGTEYVIKLCKLDDCSQTVSRNDPDAKLHAVVLEGAITLTTDDELQILMALGEYGTATSESLILEEGKQVPVGFLDAEESHKYNVTIPQQQEQERGSSNAWKWIVAVLLLAVGL